MEKFDAIVIGSGAGGLSTLYVWHEVVKKF